MNWIEIKKGFYVKEANIEAIGVTGNKEITIRMVSGDEYKVGVGFDTFMKLVNHDEIRRNRIERLATQFFE